MTLLPDYRIPVSIGYRRRHKNHENCHCQEFTYGIFASKQVMNDSTMQRYLTNMITLSLLQFLSGTEQPRPGLETGISGFNHPDTLPIQLLRPPDSNTTASSKNSFLNYYQRNFGNIYLLIIIKKTICVKGVVNMVSI